jgi:hypothetical protein
MTVNNIINENIQGVRFFSPTPGESTDNPSVVEGGTSVGGQASVLTADVTTHQLMEQILIELRKLNLRQESAFEETVKEEDLCE